MDRRPNDVESPLQQAENKMSNSDIKLARKLTDSIEEVMQGFQDGLDNLYAQIDKVESLMNLKAEVFVVAGSLIPLSRPNDSRNAVDVKNRIQQADNKINSDIQSAFTASQRLEEVFDEILDSLKRLRALVAEIKCQTTDYEFVTDLRFEPGCRFLSRMDRRPNDKKNAAHVKNRFQQEANKMNSVIQSAHTYLENVSKLFGEIIENLKRLLSLTTDTEYMTEFMFEEGSLAAKPEIEAITSKMSEVTLAGRESIVLPGKADVPESEENVQERMKLASERSEHLKEGEDVSRICSTDSVTLS